MAHVPEALPQRAGGRGGLGGGEEAASSCGRQAASHAAVCVAQRGTQQRDGAEGIAGRDAQASVERGARRAGAGADAESEEKLAVLRCENNTSLLKRRNRMLHSALQIVLGCVFLFWGTFLYAQRGGVGPLLMLVIGAILLTVGAVVMNVRQALRDESKRREQESKPVLNILDR